MWNVLEHHYPVRVRWLIAADWGHLRVAVEPGTHFQHAWVSLRLNCARYQLFGPVLTGLLPRSPRGPDQIDFGTHETLRSGPTPVALGRTLGRPPGHAPKIDGPPKCSRPFWNVHRSLPRCRSPTLSENIFKSPRGPLKLLLNFNWIKSTVRRQQINSRVRRGFTASFPFKIDHHRSLATHGTSNLEIQG